MYSKNGNLYATNKIITLNSPFSEIDKETQEILASTENEHKSRITGIFQIEKSR
jgi:hypothetical protein